MRQLHIISLLLLVSLFACAKRVTQEELIEGALEIRINQWKESEIDLCKEEALKRAEAYVDSFLVAISLESKLDTISKPAKPVKPEKPIFREKPDSLKVDKMKPKGNQE